MPGVAGRHHRVDPRQICSPYACVKAADGLGDVEDRTKVLVHVIGMNIVEYGILVHDLQLIVRAQEENMRAVLALPLRERRDSRRVTLLPLRDLIDPYHSEPDAVFRPRKQPGRRLPFSADRLVLGHPIE